MGNMHFCFFDFSTIRIHILFGFGLQLDPEKTFGFFGIRILICNNAGYKRQQFNAM
jgi:hypothetical protein